MTPTRPSTLVALTALGVALGWFVQTLLATSGRPVLVPPVTLALALFAVGAIVVALAVPVRRVARGRSRDRIDPLYATRVVLLAKASSISGALLGGLGIGVVVYLLTRPVLPIGSTLQAVAALVGAVVLLAGGLLAEQMCRVPPDDDDEDDDGAGGGRRPVRVRP